MGQTEEFAVQGEELMDKVRELIREGNVRRLTVTDPDDRTILDIPLTIGVVGAVFAPFAAVVGMIAALVTDCTVTVVRDDTAESDEAPQSDEAGAE